MLLHEFKYQEKQKKTEMLSKYGVYLTSRLVKGYQIFLFAVSSFYVEVYFDLEHELMSYIKAFSGVDDLDPYLENIDLPPTV
jgi:hypothetical protein